MRFRRGTTKEHPGKLTESQGPAWGDWAGPEWAGAVSQKRLGQEQNGGHFWARLWLSFKGPCPRGVTLWASADFGSWGKTEAQQYANEVTTVFGQ